MTTFKVCLLGISGQLGSCITRNGTLEHRAAGVAHSPQFLVLLLSSNRLKLQMLKVLPPLSLWISDCCSKDGVETELRVVKMHCVLRRGLKGEPAFACCWGREGGNARRRRLRGSRAKGGRPSPPKRNNFRKRFKQPLTFWWSEFSTCAFFILLSLFMK